MLYERPRVRALARADKFDRFVSILVFIPREKYDTDVRTRVAAFLAQIYKGRLSASYVSFPEGSLARVHYIIGRYEGETPVIERATLEAGISAIAATWGDKLKAALATSTDGMRARMLANRYARAFTGGYTEAFGTAQAIADIATIEKLTPARPVAISVYRIEGEDDPTRFGLKVFSRGAPLSLSYRVPVIENHGLRVVNERTYQIVPSATPAPAPVWLHDMTIEANDGKPIVISTEFNHRLEASIMAVVGDRAESDGYNALILRTALGWREISAIRALSRYLRQIRAPFSQGLYVGDFAQEHGDHHQHCRSVPGPLRPEPRRHRMPSARHARRPSSPRSRSSSNPSPRSTKTASCAFSPIWCRPPSAPICGRSARTGIRVR